MFRKTVIKKSKIFFWNSKTVDFRNLRKYQSNPWKLIRFKKFRKSMAYLDFFRKTRENWKSLEIFEIFEKFQLISKINSKSRIFENRSIFSENCHNHRIIDRKNNPFGKTVIQYWKFLGKIVWAFLTFPKSRKNLPIARSCFSTYFLGNTWKFKQKLWIFKWKILRKKSSKFSIDFPDLP